MMEEKKSSPEDKKFALLIDSDNVSAKYISCILGELTKYGVVTYKRIYGDWTSTQTTKWKSVLLESSIMPIQQFSNTTGKNSTDSALIIDAMDILYASNVDGFCIVSSDSDFTRLASRLRESGMMVIGMGEKKTPRSFRMACTVFTNLEIILDQESGADGDGDDSEEPETCSAAMDKEAAREADKSEIVSAIVDIITENENNGKKTGLGEIGSRLIKKYPDFDVRTFGYSLLSKFLEEIPSFVLEREDSTVTVSLKDNKQTSHEITMRIKGIVENAGQKGMDLSELGNLVHQKYPGFNVKDYGYSKFSKYLENIDGLSMHLDTNNKKVVCVRK